jgi:type II secretory ATPase GspE/PulE/Tfp pilus assembly ATPase PilB-like protein
MDAAGEAGTELTATPFEEITPPLCTSLPANAFGPGEEIIANLNAGGKLVGQLQSLMLEKGELYLQADNQPETIRLKIEDLMTLHLTKVRYFSLLMENAQPAGKSGAATKPGKETPATASGSTQEFEIRFKDGNTLEGNTFGFRTNRHGLSLYLANNPQEYTYCFVPHSAIEGYRIGPHIGEVLIEEQLVTAAQLQSALSMQQAQREQPLGQYLRSKAIITADELKDALKQQRTIPNMRLGDILLNEKLLTEEQLNQALETQKQDRRVPLGEILVRQGIVSMDDIQRSLAKKLGIPFVDLREFEVDQGAIHLVPESLVRKHTVLPLHKFDKKLVVAMENPMDLDTLDAIAFHIKMRIEPVMAAKAELERLIESEYSIGTLQDADLEELSDFSEMEEAQEIVDEPSVADNIVVKLANKIIYDAYKKGASDIHIEPSSGNKKTLIRFRKDGVLLNYYEVPAKMRNALVARIKIMCDLDISERRKPQDGKLVFRKFSTLPIELRVVTIPTVGMQEDVVMRVLSSGKPLALNKLGLNDQDLQNLTNMIALPYGIFFVCGPTGSGKTTTLHSILSHINTPDRKIWTVEDPVEITQPGLRQVQVNPKIGLNFATAMRSFLRADPDIIMVGEMRDKETTAIGIEASLTGHLVFATLHTNTAPESILRLLDMGMDRFNFTDALIGVLAQRLTRSLCPHCKQEEIASEEEIKALAAEYSTPLTKDKKKPTITKIQNQLIKEWKEKYAGDEGQITLYRPVGCNECDHTGYLGRTAIFELLVASNEIKKSILGHATVADIQTIALNEGMRSLKQDGIEKVLQGITDIHQVRKVCIE